LKWKLLTEKSDQEQVKSMHIGTVRVLGISIAITDESDKRGDARKTEDSRRLFFNALLRFAEAATRTFVEPAGKLSRNFFKLERPEFLDFMK